MREADSEGDAVVPAGRASSEEDETCQVLETLVLLSRSSAFPAALTACCGAIVLKNHLEHMFSIPSYDSCCVQVGEIFVNVLALAPTEAGTYAERSFASIIFGLLSLNVDRKSSLFSRAVDATGTLLCAESKVRLL